MVADSSASARSVAAGGSVANARFKASFSSLLGAAIALSAGMHFAVLSMATMRTVEDYSTPKTQPLQQLALHTPVELPPPPDLIIRPGVPVLATVFAPVEVLIPELRFEDLPVIDIPPPPLPEVDLSERPIFIPREVEPVLQNRLEIERFLSQNYPPVLQRAGVGGTAVFEAFLDEDGLVQKTLRVSSTGFSSLDAIAERVFSRMRFSPAYYRYQPTPVWVRMPIRFVAN